MAKSDYINNFIPFIDDSIGNIAYTMRYLITTPKYGRIIYDKYRNLYYRLAFHQTEYVNPDGKTVKRNFDQPWSLIILNGECKKINEIKFDPSKYASSPIYIVKDGVMISKRDDSILDKYQWDFVLFEVNQ